MLKPPRRQPLRPRLPGKKRSLSRKKRKRQQRQSPDPSLRQNRKSKVPRKKRSKRKSDQRSIDFAVLSIPDRISHVDLQEKARVWVAPAWKRPHPVFFAGKPPSPFP